MAHSQDPAFERFVTQRKKDLQRIARHTRGEHQLPDVINEAWLAACDLAARRGTGHRAQGTGHRAQGTGHRAQAQAQAQAPGE